MNRLLVLSGLALWFGLVLLLSQVRWFARRSLTERLSPYVPGGMGTRRRAGILSVESFAEAIGPFARALGQRMSRLFGISEDLDRKLVRIHSNLDVTLFRTRQVGWGLAGFAGTVLAVIALRPALPIAGIMIVGGIFLPFLLLEQQVVGASDRWKRSLYLELPVIAEQLGMLIGAGFSLLAAIDRVAHRGDGACAQDLRRVLRRVRQGTTEAAALNEWAELSDVDAVRRLVSVLDLNREASDLGRLIAEEARNIRRDVHRELIETMERRSQQIWIPVTVATLVPGVIFVAIPFAGALEALNL